MNEQLIQQLKDSLKEFIAQILQSGQPIDAQLETMIAQAMEHVANRIQQLRSESANQVPATEGIASVPSMGVHVTPTEPTPETPGTAATPPTGGTPPPIPPTNSRIPELDQAPYPSSNINSFKYNPDTQELYIKFHGRDSAESGPTYLYQGIPQNIYNVFHRGAVGPRTSGSNRYHTWHRNILPSLGAAAYQLIREGGYNYQRVG